MKLLKLSKKTMLMTVLLGLTNIAMAHTGHGTHDHGSMMSTLLAGLSHPISGLDHIVLAVGMGMLFFKRKELGLSLLVSSLILGFVAVFVFGQSIFTENAIEMAILASVIVTAVAIMAQRTKAIQTHHKAFLVIISASLFSLAMFHGMAHALERPTNGVAISFGLGMIASMSMLFAVGVGLMTWIQKLAQTRPTMAWIPTALASASLALILVN